MQLRLAAIFACLIGASPALAQSTCGALGDGGRWIGGSAEHSDVSSAETYLEQMALVLGGNTYVAMFTAGEDGDVRIEAEARGTADPLIEVFNQDGTIIATDDDSGGNTSARVEMPLTAGSYCVHLKAVNDTPMTAFLRVGLDHHDPLTTGQDSIDIEQGEQPDAPICDSAVPFPGLGQTSTQTANDAPAYAVTLSEAVALTITAANEAADPAIKILDAEGILIAENDDADGLNSRIEINRALPAGEYCVTVAALSDSDQPIAVAIAALDEQDVLARQYATGETAPPLDGSAAVTDLGALSGKQRNDVMMQSDASWYQVTIPDNGLLLVETIIMGDGGDPWLALFDELGRPMTQNDDFGVGLNARITARVDAGVYLIALRNVADDQQGRVSLLLERFVPAP